MNTQKSAVQQQFYLITKFKAKVFILNIRGDIPATSFFFAVTSKTEWSAVFSMAS